MRLTKSALLVALLALAWCGVAAADDSATDTDNTSSLAVMNEVSLDTAFEQATSPKNDSSLLAVAGPSTMECENDSSEKTPETCVVTAEGTLAAVPAAMAHPQ